MFLYKLFLFGVLGNMVLFIYATYFGGWHIPRCGRSQEFQLSAVKNKNFYGGILLAITFIFIGLIEAKKFLFGPVMHDSLFRVHLFFAILFFVPLLLRIAIFNGRLVKYFWQLDFIWLMFSVPTVLTGVPMILRMH